MLQRVAFLLQLLFFVQFHPRVPDMQLHLLMTCHNAMQTYHDLVLLQVGYFLESQLILLDRQNNLQALAIHRE